MSRSPTFVADDLPSILLISSIVIVVYNDAPSSLGTLVVANMTDKLAV